MLKPMVTALVIGIITLVQMPASASANDAVFSEDQSKAVILAYHRIGEPAHPHISLETEQFKNHLKIIKNQNYNVLPLDELIDALKNKQPLPPKTIAITFEGGYRSVYNNAIPLLMEEDLPFTLFFASDATSIPTYLSWQDLRKIRKYKHASFGILPSKYAHITHLPKAEQTRLINKARMDFKDHMKQEARFFSYPFGEVSKQLKDIIRAQQFKAAFGLNSGPSHAGSDLLDLPRFSMTDGYGTPERFEMVTNTYPIPVTDVEPQDRFITKPVTQIGFTAKTPDLGNTSPLPLKKLSCHISGHEKPRIEILGDRVEIFPQTPITSERTRLNCTMPMSTNASSGQPTWRWFCLLFHGPQAAQ